MEYLKKLKNLIHHRFWLNDLAYIYTVGNCWESYQIVLFRYVQNKIIEFKLRWHDEIHYAIVYLIISKRTEF